MDKIIKEYEVDFSNTCAEITVACGVLKQASNAETVVCQVASIDQLFVDADETLDQLALESSTHSQLAIRVTSYRNELRRLRVVYKTCQREASERSSRIELLSSHTSDHGSVSDGFSLPHAETDLLLENADLLASSGQQLEAGRRLLKETENIGAGVLSDLGAQRETLERSRGQLRDVETRLGDSSALLSKMVFRAQQNKLVLYMVGVLLLAGLLFAAYKLLT